MLQIKTVEANWVALFAVVEDVSAHGNVIGEFLVGQVGRSVVAGGGIGQNEFGLCAAVFCALHLVVHGAIIEMKQFLAILFLREK